MGASVRAGKRTVSTLIWLIACVAITARPVFVEYILTDEHALFHGLNEMAAR